MVGMKLAERNESDDSRYNGQEYRGSFYLLRADQGNFKARGRLDSPSVRLKVANLASTRGEAAKDKGLRLMSRWTFDGYERNYGSDPGGFEDDADAYLRNFGGCSGRRNS